MAKPGKIPNFRKLYPEASDEVIELLRRTERKMQYQEYDLKSARIIIDKESHHKIILPSREISYERMVEEKGELAYEGIDTEKIILNREVHQALYSALENLAEEEKYLIRQIFFDGKTEREMAAELGISQKAVNKRCHKILNKMKKFLQKM